MPGWVSPRTSSTGAPVAAAGSRGGIELVDGAADHQRDQPLDGHLGLRRRADDMAVAQHDDVVAQPHDVAEDVADVDDADALRLAAGR